MKKIGLILAATYLFSCQWAWSQSTTPLKLVHADRLESYSKNGYTIRRLVGHVRLERKGFILTCQTAEHNLDLGRVQLLGLVRLYNDTTDIRAKRAVYYLKKEIARLEGNVQYRHRNNLLKAQKITYFVQRKEAIATGEPILRDSARVLSADTIQYSETKLLGAAWPHATLKDSSRRSLISGVEIHYWYLADSMLAAPKGQLTKWDSTGDTVLTLSADTLILQRDLFRARGEVVFRHVNSRVVCGRADYYLNTGKAYLWQKPLLTQEAYRLTGERFILHFKNDELERVIVPEDPIFTQSKTWQDSLFQDRLNGKYMDIHLENGRARQVTIEGMASSRFYALEDTLYKGLNIVSGDSILILLNDSTITQVTIAGATQGKFIPAPAANLKGPVRYKAGKIIYDLPYEHSALLTDARIEYQDMSLEAGRIDVLWRKSLLQATSLGDSAETEPVFNQTGQAPFRGHEMVYDLRTERGKVLAGQTKYQEGHYYGQTLARITPEVYQVEEGYYTTCDLEPDPHYYFYSRQMKLLQDRWLIARPLWLYIADVPLFYLPFAVLPQRHGRTSGFLIPSYDYVASHGRALKGFGYYWAASDYLAAKFIVDFYDGERYTDTSGVLRRTPILQYRTIINYKRRYRLAGSIRGALTPDWSNGHRIYRWSLAFQHAQTIDPTLKVNASGRLYGDARFEQDFNSNQDTRLNKRLRSAINLNKRWPELKSSLAVNASYDQDLQVGERLLAPPLQEGVQLQGPVLLIPKLSFSRQSSALFPATSTRQHWYNRLRWNYRSAFSNPVKIIYRSQRDSSDSLVWVRTTEKNQVWTHSASLSGSFNLWGIINANTSIAGNGGFIFQYALPKTDDSGRVMRDSTGKLQTEMLRGWLGRTVFSLNAGLSTKLYGLFPLHLGPLQAIRHIVTPSLTISYAPTFAEPRWGYVQQYQDTAGTINYDPFKGTPLGATPANKVLSFNFRIGNEFDYKLIRRGQEQKGKLLTWSISGNYNAAADSLRASDLSNSIRFYLGKFLSVDLRSTVDLYQHDSTGRKIDRFTWPRLSRQAINFGFKFSGHGWKLAAFSDTASVDTARGEDFGLNESSWLRTGDLTGGELWQASFSLGYNLTHNNPFAEPNKSFWLNTVLNLHPTRSWKIRYSARFDLLNHRLVSQNLSLNRDLHCWTLQFNWLPTGRYSSWNITIRVKAPHLRDLKIKHTSRAFRL